MEQKPSHKIGFQSSFDCNLLCSTTNATGLDADPMTNADRQQPSRSQIILNVAKGNKLDTETTVPGECFDQSKFELMSHIENRIQHYCCSKAPGRIQTQKAEKISQDEDCQIAATQGPNFCSINKKAVGHIGLKDNLTKKSKGENRQRIAVLASSGDRHSTQSKEVKHVQRDSSTTPPIEAPLFQSKSVETAMKIPDEQSCRREMGVEGIHGYTYHQSIFPGQSTLEKPDNKIPKRRKIRKGKQTQIESQSLESNAVALSQTNVGKEKGVRGMKKKLSDSVCLKNERQKYSNKAKKETTMNNREFEEQCHGSLELSSVANQFTSFKHVLKPVAQNNQPFTADSKDKAAEASQKVSKMNMTDSKKKQKVENQCPLIHNFYNLQAIGNYIKWGTFNVEMPSSQAPYSKNGAAMSFQTKIDQNGNFMNSSNSEVHSNTVGLDDSMVGAAIPRTNLSKLP